MENDKTKGSILIVDDTPDNLRLLTKILKDDTYHVRATKTGREALASVSAELPDLVLLDIKMPDMDGYEVCRRLKADDASKNIPVIFISALDSIDDKKKGFEVGCSDFITKPFQPEEVLARVRAHVDINRMRISLERQKDFFNTIINSLNHPFYVIDANDYTIQLANKKTGTYVKGKTTCHQLTHKQDMPCNDPKNPCTIELVKKNGRPVVLEHEHYDENGNKLFVDVNAYPIFDEAGNISHVIEYSIDITERKKVVEREKLMRDVLELLLLNRTGKTTEIIRDILLMIKKSTDFEAVGIRLKEGDDYPYYHSEGFSDQFIKMENSLCHRDEAGKIVNDGKGNPILECMCGNILRDRTDPALPFFTKTGSFWSNCTTDLLASTSEADRQAKTRNRCNSSGYESVALMPLRVGEEIIGLLQFNDHRKNKFTPEFISFFEGLSSIIGIALSRKQAEDSLLESEEKFKAIFDNASDGLILTDIETRKFHDANKSMCRMLDYSFEELVKLKVMDIHPEEELPYILEQINKQMKEPLTSSEDIPMKRKDGSIFFANVSGSIITISEKKYALGVFRDITERKRMEAEREKTLMWQQNINLIRQSLLAPASLEKKLKIMTEEIVKLFGADFCRIWLIRPGDVCDKDCIHAGAKGGAHACLHKDKCLHLMSSSGRYTHTDGKVHRRVPFDCYKIGLIASGEEHKLLTNDAQNDPRIHNLEWARELGLESFAGYQLKVPGGNTLGVLALFARHQILPDEEAMLDGLSGTVSFVIQQAVADDALRENEEKYRTLFEFSQDALMILDPSSRLFTSCNLSTLKLFSVKNKEELFLLGPLALYPERQPDGRLSGEKVMEMIEIALRDGHHFFESTHKRLSGEEFEAAVQLTRIKIKDKVLIQASVRDITEQKRMNKIIKENKLKSQFIENMSHEIRTPINGIMGYIQLLSSTGLNTEQKEYVENAMICNNNLLNIVNDILDFSTFEKENIEIRQNEFNISNLVKEAVTPFGLLAKEKAILLNYSVSDKIPKIVVGDKLRILQILQKLLDNAVKFTSSGKIDITIEEASRNADCISLKFCVSDTGIGIAENRLKDLFKPFVQLDMSTTKKYCGTGLGLAIARKLIELMGGRIEVISKPGEGSHFIFELKFGIA